MTDDTKRPPFQIVFFDETEATRRLVVSILETHLGCQVYPCAHASEVLALEEAKFADLFLFDVSGGARKGAELCAAIKESPELKDVPIVLLSNFKDPVKRVEGLKAGGVDYIDKPFYPEELVTRLRIHLDMHRLRQENQERVLAQQALIRVMCHDLINPIFAAHSLLELRMMKNTVDMRTLNMVVSSCQSAMDIIQNVREQHALVAAGKRRQEELVPLSEAFDECVRTLELRYEKKSVALAATSAPEARVRINRVVLVASILNNLLTNALKFSRPGSVVRMTSRIEEMHGGRLCIVEVVDQGIGMPEEILANLFVEGAKVSRSGTEAEEGTGFGMPLVKRYVEGAGGTIEVESVEEGADEPSGTTIRLAFPQA